MATLIVGVAIGSSAPGRQSRELGLAAYVHLFRLLLGENWAPTIVYFSHSKPQAPTLHQHFFRCQVQFDSPLDGFECPVADLGRVNGHADAALASYATLLLDALPGERRDVASMVVRLVHALLPMGRASLRNVARAMARNPRQLQRQLAAEGTAFDILLADVRSDLSLKLLQEPALTIDAVAARLGYAHPSAFIRFFRHRHQMTPGQWRGQHGHAVSHHAPDAPLPLPLR